MGVLQGLRQYRNAAGITGRTINEKCPIHQGVDTVEVDNDRGRAE